MGRGEGLLEGVEKVQLWGRKRKVIFFEIGFFEDGTNIMQSSSAGRENKRRRLLYIRRDDKVKV